MKNSIKFFSGLSVVVAIIITTASAFAYHGDPSVQGPNYSPERHESMTKAFETKDYKAWKELMNDRGRVTQVINADNFARFAEAHNLAKEGKLEEAKAIRAELGLGLRDGKGKGQGFGDNGRRQGSRNGNRNFNN